MKTVASLIAILLSLVSISALASELECRKAKKGNDNCFLEYSNKISATVTSKKVVLRSSELKELEGTFEKTVSSTGFKQYSAEDLSNYLDQSDLGKIFVSPDESKLVLSVRFTSDDGDRSFWSCTYQCE